MRKNPSALAKSFARHGFPALVGFCLAMGLLLPILSAMQMGGGGIAFFICLLSAILCALMDLKGRVRLAALGAGGLLIALYCLTGGIPAILGMLSGAVHLISGNTEPIRMYGREVAIVAGALLTCFGWAMAKQSAGFYPALSFVMVCLIILWFSGKRNEIFLLSPALIALAALFARSAGEETPYGRILLSSALAVLLALCILPFGKIASPALQAFAERVRTYITDTLFMTEPRSVYSIQVDGFMPLETRLGGPANIQERPVMTVETAHTLLLRGVVMDFYTGISWVDTMPARRHLYQDTRQKGARADILDEGRPQDDLRADPLFDTYPAAVTMQSGSASTLFLPARAGDLATSSAMVPYFNASGEIFITRDLAPGDSYSFSAPRIAASDPRLPALLEKAAAQGEGRDMSPYLALHDYIAPDVITLTERVTATSHTPLEKALVIRDYLRINYFYTLTPEIPPDNQDFVSFFLLRGKEGYCTYFASAMAVMGRIAGLPTRYVEGYLAQPADGVALVTSKKAHAWAEVYFEGFGWIPFDATPSDGMGGPRGDDNPAPPEPGEQDEDEAPAEPTPSPEPEPEDGGDGDEPDPPPDDGPQDEPTPSPAPEPPTEPETTPMPTPDERTGEDHQRDKQKSRWWLWLLLLLLIAALAYRAYRTWPDTVVKACRDDGERLLLWYRAILGLHQARGWPPHPYETPAQYLARLTKEAPPDSGLEGLSEALTHLGYGRGAVDPGAVPMARQCYLRLHRDAPLKAKALWFLRRMQKGLGSVRQVP